jgi:deazaflavin-dependent oxidoreductase (nitroreductase family)
MPAAATPIPKVDPLEPKSAAMRLAERMAAFRPVTWFLVNLGRHIDPQLMRWSGGRVNTTGTSAVVILHHTGAKTGKRRETPLAYFTDGDDVVLVASKGGAPEHPAWFHNVRAVPNIELWLGSHGGPHRAHVAGPEERARLWPLAVATYSGFEGYQARVPHREIPLVICSPG